MSGPAAVVVVAAGSGRRLDDGVGVPKQYRELLGRPLLRWALAPFLDHPSLGHCVVVLPPHDLPAPPQWLRALPVSPAAGGAERGDSVWSGLCALPPEIDTVLVHDAARPFASRGLIERVLAAARQGGAVPGLPLTDTLKEVDEAGNVVATRPRERLWRAQTPQGFPLQSLREAYRRAREEGFRATDDAALCERYGMPVRMVMGDALNLKVTTQADLARAELLARGLPPPP